MKRATHAKLSRWHARLSRAHAIALSVADEAEQCVDLDYSEKVLLADPIIELHAALSQVEGLIEAVEGEASQ